MYVYGCTYGVANNCIINSGDRIAAVHIHTVVS